MQETSFPKERHVVCGAYFRTLLCVPDKLRLSGTHSTGPMPFYFPPHNNMYLLNTFPTLLRGDGGGGDA